MALLAAWGVWVVVAQAFLATPLLRYLINRETPKIHVEYASAWSIWPGTVHLRGLVITSQDHAVQWRLGLDEVSATIAIEQLPARIFHARRVRTQGVQFALRRRVLWSGVKAGVPLIEGLPPVPLKEEGPDDDNPDFRYRIFTVWLEDIEGAGVRQIWIDRFRLEGAARVAGAFYLKPIRDVWIQPAELRLQGGTVSAGEERIADNLDATLRVRMGPFDPRVTKRLALLRQLDVDLDGTAQVAGGPLKTALRVQAGQLLPGSELDARLRGLSVGSFVAGSLAVRVESAPPQRVRLLIDGTDLRWESSRATHARFDLAADLVDLAEPRLPERARATLSQASLLVQGETVRGDLRLDARLASNDVSGDADLAGTELEIDGARVIHRDGSADADPGWWGRFVFQSARVNLAEPAIEGTLTATCRDARPIVGLYVNRADLPDFVKGLFAMSHLSVSASGAAGRDWIALHELKASGDGASVRATLLREKGVARGALQVMVGGASIGVDLDHGGHRVQLITPGDFFESRKAELARAGRSMPRSKRARRIPAVQTAR